MPSMLRHTPLRCIFAASDGMASTFEGATIFGVAHRSNLYPASRRRAELMLLCPCNMHLLQVWIVDDGQITHYDGDFEDYRQELIKEIHDEMDEDEENGYIMPTATPVA